MTGGLFGSSRELIPMHTIDVGEAMTNLDELLDRVAQGEEICIARHGKPVARLVPDAGPAPSDIRAAIAVIKELRKGRTLGGITIRELIEEGRRF